MLCPFCGTALPTPPDGADAICFPCGKAFRYAGRVDVWYGDTRHLWLLVA